MANILKRIRKSSLSSSRHEKLLEDPQIMEDPLVEGVTFLVKYLGNCGVENDSEEEETAAAIKNIITTAKKENSKLTRVSLTISEKGLKMMDITSKEIKMDISIYNISYCTADPTFDHVFAFICRTSAAANDLTCYAFLCPKRKMAKAATLTIAQGFSLAYQSWQAAQVPVKRENEARNAVGNVVVTQAVVEKQPVTADESMSTAGTSEPSGQSEDLLIDWTDEKEKKKSNTFSELEDSESKVSTWIQFNDLDSKEMDSQFERLTLRNAPMQILNQLPPDSGSFDFGAFACSPDLSDYGSSPGYGLSLTPSQLMSPVGSPCTNQFQPGSPHFNKFSSQTSPLAGSPRRGSQHGQNPPYQDTFKN